MSKLDSFNELRSPLCFLDSNHYGIAGWYSRKAMEVDLIVSEMLNMIFPSRLFYLMLTFRDE